MPLVRCVPATQGAHAVLSGSRKAGLPARAHQNLICVGHAVSAEPDSRGPEGRGGKPGWTLSKPCCLEGRELAGMARGSPSQAQDLQRREDWMGREGGSKDEARETAVASSRPRAKGTGEGQAPRGPVPAERSGLQGKPSLPAYLLASLCLVLGLPRDQGSTGQPGKPALLHPTCLTQSQARRGQRKQSGFWVWIWGGSR